MRAKIAGLLMLLASGRLSAQGADDAEGIRLYDARQAVAAKAIFARAIRANPRDARAASYLGRIAFDGGNYSEAADWFEKAADLEPRRGEHYRRLGAAYGRQAMRANPFRQAMLARKTINAWDHAVELDPSDIEARFDRVEYYRSAPSFLGGGIDKAYAEAEEIRKRDPYRGLASIGTLYAVEKKWADAERTIESLIRQYPDSISPRFSLGYIDQARGEYEKAFSYFESLARSYPGEPNALYQIGKTGAISGLHLDRSEATLREYLAHPPKTGEPSWANAHFRLGQVYERGGARDRARAEYQLAVQLDPHLKDAATALAKL